MRVRFFVKWVVATSVIFILAVIVLGLNGIVAAIPISLVFGAVTAWLDDQFVVPN